MIAYTEEDKLTYLVERNGQVAKLISRFDLEIDFTKPPPTKPVNK